MKSATRVALVGIVLTLAFAFPFADSAKGARPLCELCYDLGSYGGTVCLAVGSGYGSDDCRIEVHSLIVPTPEGGVQELRFERCIMGSSCDFAY